MNYSMHFQVSGVSLGLNTIDMPEGTVAGATLRWDSFDNDDGPVSGTGTVNLPTGTFTLPPYVNAVRSVQITLTQNVTFADEDNLTVTASVTSLAAGASPTVTASKPAAKVRNFDFGIPKGDKGDAGAAGSGVLWQQSIPVMLPTNCQVNANGNIVLNGANAGAHPYAYIYFAAGTLWKAGNGNAADNAAGFFYVRLSTTTAGQVFKETLSIGNKPVFIANPTPIVQPTALGNAGYVSAALPSARVKIPANSMGANGALRVSARIACRYNSNYSSEYKILLGGVEVGALFGYSNSGVDFALYINNMGQANKQCINNGPNNSSTRYFDINTAQDQFLDITLKGAGPDDCVEIIRLSVEVMASA